MNVWLVFFLRSGNPHVLFIFSCFFFILTGSAVSETLYQADYQYDSRGFITNLVDQYGENVVIRELAYNSHGQLIDEKIGAYQAEYQYDHLGNRLSQTLPGPSLNGYQYNTRNELLQEILPGVTNRFSYDSNGSLTQKVTQGVATAYEWDSRVRLRRVTINNLETFQADYAGGLNRLRKAEGSTSKVYRHDGSTAIQEVDGSGAVKELMRSDRGASTVGGILYSADEEGTSTYSYNGVGSTVLLSDEDRATRSILYDAFGNILEADEGIDEDRLANTKELDKSTGLYFHGARYYDAKNGRYISMDPARDGANHYVYANNAPLSYIDSTGLFAFPAAVGIGVMFGITVAYWKPYSYKTTESAPQLGRSQTTPLPTQSREFSQNMQSYDPDDYYKDPRTGDLIAADTHRARANLEMWANGEMLATFAGPAKLPRFLGNLGARLPKFFKGPQVPTRPVQRGEAHTRANYRLETMEPNVAASTDERGLITVSKTVSLKDLETILRHEAFHQWLIMNGDNVVADTVNSFHTLLYNTHTWRLLEEGAAYAYGNRSLAYFGSPLKYPKIYQINPLRVAGETGGAVSLGYFASHIPEDLSPLDLDPVLKESVKELHGETPSFWEELEYLFQ